MERIHGTSVVFCGRGLLIRGASGSGKTDLALRLIDAGGVLIADDYSEVTAKNGHLFATAPESIKGLIEIRGYGPVHLPHVENRRLETVINCVTDAPERLPEPKSETILGVALPCHDIRPFEASSVAKIRLILQYPAVL
jgi:serine kinase of HPr protein (carbohydrate metabolism regulator)